MKVEQGENDVVIASRIRPPQLFFPEESILLWIYRTYPQESGCVRLKTPALYSHIIALTNRF
jgi:hypothetical protein